MACAGWRPRLREPFWRPRWRRLRWCPLQAAVAGVSPVDPQTGFPTWYSDGTVKLQLCYMAGSGCLSEPPIPAAPASYPDNFPDEAFWFQAAAEGGTLLFEAALEAAHANEAVIPGDQQGFARLRFHMDGLVPGASTRSGIPTGSIRSQPILRARKRPGEIKQTIDAASARPRRGLPATGPVSARPSSGTTRTAPPPPSSGRSAPRRERLATSTPHARLPALRPASTRDRGRTQRGRPRRQHADDQHVHRRRA